MSQEYLALKDLEKHPGYLILQELWIQQRAKIDAAKDKAARSNKEDHWRYWAGQEAGFTVATTQLQRALSEMELSEENQESEAETAKFIEALKIKGDTNK